jgi:ferrous iron transport protein B
MSHHRGHSLTLNPASGLVALVGNPNVGKSVLFHRLTGKYVTVANYPGTTVEITQGLLRGFKGVTLVDTPGIVSFPSRSEDEQVTGRLLLQTDVQKILQVGDAKNLRRTLHLSVQLAEFGVPMALALNMIDEASARGLALEVEPVAEALGLPVVVTVATRGQGVEELVEAVNCAGAPRLQIRYPAEIEQALAEIGAVLPSAHVSPRGLGLLWLSGDPVCEKWLSERLKPEDLDRLRIAINRIVETCGVHPAELILQTREAFVEGIAAAALVENGQRRPELSVRLGRLATHPLWGLPLLALALLGMYWFVGVFGAGTLVGLLEERLFGQLINPWLVEHVRQWIGLPWLADFFVGDYGLWTMGFTYAFALLLPIVLTFFITFGLLEDSGYLPRLAVLANRVFSWMGLNGQAVLPMVLGLGCVTMATMTTRVLSRRRDRLLVTFLLALAVPCSAQLGVVLGMLAGISFSGALIWTGVLLLVLILVGWLAARLLPGQRTPLVVELPPLRLPVLSNVLVKTAARLEWYIKEAVPFFLLGAVLLYLLDVFKLLPGLIAGLEPVVTQWLGLPAEAATAFLLGLMRRDFAATGLFLMQSHGQLSPIQALTAITTITLFVPCIASMFMIIKERGWKLGLGMIAFIFPFALLVGGLLYRLLGLVGWNG